MCYTKLLFSQCPETKESLQARRENPDETRLIVGNMWEDYRVFIAHPDKIGIFNNIPKEPWEELHVQSSIVHCAHPYNGLCNPEEVVVSEQARGRCCYCLRISHVFPHRTFLRLEQFRGIQSQLSGSHLNPGNMVWQYFKQLVILVKHSVGRRIPGLDLQQRGEDTLLMEVRAERFCRYNQFHRKEHSGVGAATAQTQCKCAPQHRPWHGNVGRALRMHEASHILENNVDIITTFMADPSENDNWQLRNLRHIATQRFAQRSTGDWDLLSVAVHDLCLHAETRHRDCVSRLDAAVLDYLPIVTGHAIEGPMTAAQHARETLFRARNLVTRPFLAWIAHDNGLVDELVTEISNMMIHWFLAVDTPASADIDAFCNDASRSPADAREVRSDIVSIWRAVDAYFPLGTDDGWERFQLAFLQVPMSGWKTLRDYLADRNAQYAAARAMLPQVERAALKHTRTVAAVREVNPSCGGVCDVCGDAFADDVEDLRPVQTCSAHFACRKCIVSHALLRDAIRNPANCARCPFCREPLRDFYLMSSDTPDTWAMAPRSDQHLPLGAQASAGPRPSAAGLGFFWA